MLVLIGLVILVGCTQPSNTKQASVRLSQAPDILGFIARSKGGEKSAAWLTTAPCILGSSRGYTAIVEVYNGQPEFGCWRKSNTHIVGEWYVESTVSGVTTLTPTAPFDEDVSEYDLLPGKAWPSSVTDVGTTIPGKEHDGIASESQPSIKQAWYAANSTFVACIESRGPAARMQELIEMGLEPKTKEFTEAGSIYAVEVGYYTSDGESYRKYYRSKERCETEATVNGKISRIPPAYR